MSEFGTKIAKNGFNGSAGEANHLKTAATVPDDTVFQPLGGPVSVAWREGTLTRAYELQALCEWMTARDTLDSDWRFGEGGQVPPCSGQGRGFGQEAGPA